MKSGLLVVRQQIRVCKLNCVNKEENINFANTAFCMKEEFDFDSIRKKTIEQLKAGKPLLGKDDAFAPLLISILNAALEGEKMHILQKKKSDG